MAGQHDTGDDPLDVFVPLHEAALAYDTSVSALRARARSGGLRAYKVTGPHGREWRVSVRSLESAGLQPRGPVTAAADERVAELEARLATVRRLLGAEQRRADRADQELGYALLELGRLRAATSRADTTRSVEHS